MCLQSAPMSLLAVLQLHACAYVEEVMKGGSGARREYRAGQPEKSLACAPGRRGSYFEKQRNRKTKCHACWAGQGMVGGSRSFEFSPLFPIILGGATGGLTALSCVNTRSENI